MSRLIPFTLFGLIIFSAIAFFIFELPWYFVLLADIILLLLVCIIFRATVLAFYSNVVYMTGNREKAARYFKKAIDAHTKESIVYLNYAVILVREGKVQEALAYLAKAKELNKNPLAEKNIELTTASSYWLLGDVDKAIDILEDMRKKYDYVNAQVLTTLGYLYLLKNDYERAAKFTNKAIEDAPTLASAWDNLGQIYLRQDKQAEAKEVFLKALSYNAALVDSLYFMGVITKAEGNLTDAAEYFKKARASEISKLNTVTIEEIEEELKLLGEFLKEDN